jgi:hypothetical protein
MWQDICLFVYLHIRIPSCHLLITLVLFAYEWPMLSWKHQELSVLVCLHIRRLLDWAIFVRWKKQTLLFFTIKTFTLYQCFKDITVHFPYFHLTNIFYISSDSQWDLLEANVWRTCSNRKPVVVVKTVYKRPAYNGKIIWLLQNF